jgi:hypothetical protein
MVCDMISHAIANVPDIVIAEGSGGTPADLAGYTQRHAIDVVLFTTPQKHVDAPAILQLLHGNPRLGVVSMDPDRDCATVHQLAPHATQFDRFGMAGLEAAIRAGAAMKII